MYRVWGVCCWGACKWAEAVCAGDGVVGGASGGSRVEPIGAGKVGKTEAEWSEAK